MAPSSSSMRRRDMRQPRRMTGLSGRVQVPLETVSAAPDGMALGALAASASCSSRSLDGSNEDGQHRAEPAQGGRHGESHRVTVGRGRCRHGTGADLVACGFVRQQCRLTAGKAVSRRGHAAQRA